jgi:hypothetical protein
MTAAAVHRTAFWQAGLAPAATTGPQSRTCAVRLIDRRTGQTLRVNGSALVVFTRQPKDAIDELLQGRDSRHWEARIEPIEAKP